MKYNYKNYLKAANFYATHTRSKKAKAAFEKELALLNADQPRRDRCRQLRHIIRTLKQEGGSIQLLRNAQRELRSLSK